MEKKDYSWFFKFSGGDSIITEQYWRFISAEGIIVTSDDHTQQFGLPASVDAVERVKSNLNTESIEAVSHDARTGDLCLIFPNQRVIQFLQMSCGYESWRLQIHNTEVICMGGGEYSSFTRQ